MMRSLFLPSVCGLALGASGMWLAACALDPGASGGVGGYDTGAGTGANGGDAGIHVAPDAEKPPGPVTYEQLCGDGDCVPGGTPCAQPGTTSGTGGGDGGGGGGGGSGGAPLELGCQVDFRGGDPVSVCSPVGAGQLSNTCLTAADCDEGLACVTLGGGQVGTCHPYCCGDLEDCPMLTFCSPQPLADAPEVVPVCAPVDDCTPLLAGACPAGETCSVVRKDGTTSCVPIGEGSFCEPCPCAEGFMCNLGTGRCQKLCHTGGADECPGAGGTCQGGGQLPETIGACIGGDAVCGT